MLYKDRIKNLAAIYPALTRVWIRTGDPRLPLKGVWVDESKVRRLANATAVENKPSETPELAEDHLVLAA
jgi:hypothetical protein